MATAEPCHAAPRAERADPRHCPPGQVRPVLAFQQRGQTTSAGLRARCCRVVDVEVFATKRRNARHRSLPDSTCGVNPASPPVGQGGVAQVRPLRLDFELLDVIAWNSGQRETKLAKRSSLHLPLANLNVRFRWRHEVARPGYRAHGISRRGGEPGGLFQVCRRKLLPARRGTAAGGTIAAAARPSG